MAPKNKLFTSGLLTFKNKCRNTKESGREIFSQENCSPVLFHPIHLIYSTHLQFRRRVRGLEGPDDRLPFLEELRFSLFHSNTPNPCFEQKLRRDSTWRERASLIGGPGNRRIIYARNDSFFLLLGNFTE